MTLVVARATAHVTNHEYPAPAFAAGPGQAAMPAVMLARPRAAGSESDTAQARGGTLAESPHWNGWTQPEPSESIMIPKS